MNSLRDENLEFAEKLSSMTKSKESYEEAMKEIELKVKDEEGKCAALNEKVDEQDNEIKFIRNSYFISFHIC